MVSRVADGDPGHRSHKSDPALEEDLPNDLGHLKSIGREVQEGLDIRETVVSEERVDTEMAGVIGHLINYAQESLQGQLSKRQVNSPPE